MFAALGGFPMESPNPVPTIPQSLTVAEFAAAERMPRTTVYALIKDGTIRAHRIGRSLRISAEELRRIRGGAA